MKRPSIIQSIIPIVVVIGLIATNILIFGNDTLAGANQIALLFASTVAAGLAISTGVKYKDMMDKIVETIVSAMGSLFIFFLSGMSAD